MINPTKLLQFRQGFNDFQERHPKFVSFLTVLIQSGVGEGSIIEVKVTTADGKEMESNLRLSQADVDFIKGFKDI